MLRAIPGVGDAILLKLVQAFGSPDAVLSATQAALEEIGCRPPLVEAIRRGPDPDAVRTARPGTDPIAAPADYGADVSRSAVSCAAQNDPRPSSAAVSPGDACWRVIGMPWRLSGRGRSAPPAGSLAEELARELADMGFTIVSGLARGVDAAAHRGALAGKGRTLAVMGCGLDRTYPADHRHLRERSNGREPCCQSSRWGRHRTVIISLGVTALSADCRWESS